MKKSLKVMLVDDDPVTLEVVAAALESDGYDAIKREEALGTMLAVRREKPDVVLLDIHMPGLSGDALTKLIVSSKDAHEPIILLYSATQRAQLAVLSASCGASGWIEKTANLREFLERFAQLVAEATAQRERKKNPARAG
jgi:DNA-binding response OmpR family regulator